LTVLGPVIGGGRGALGHTARAHMTDKMGIAEEDEGLPPAASTSMQVPSLDQALHQVYGDSPAEGVIDLRGLTFMDSSGLSSLLISQNMGSGSGGPKLIRGSAQV
jgi:hypothetical protein